MNDTHNPGFLILAAGKAQRFGGNKLLQPFARDDDTPTVGLHTDTNGVKETVLSTVLSTTLNKILTTQSPNVGVVFSQANTDLSAALVQLQDVHPALRLFPFKQQSPGLGDSIREGVEASSRLGWTGWIVCLADMPLITTATYTQILQYSRDNQIVAPRFKGKRGHPVYFGQHCENDLKALHGDTGAKSVLQRHANAITQVDCDDSGIHIDIDTPEDLQHAQKIR